MEGRKTGYRSSGTIKEQGVSMEDGSLVWAWFGKVRE